MREKFAGGGRAKVILEDGGVNVARVVILVLSFCGLVSLATLAPAQVAKTEPQSMTKLAGAPEAAIHSFGKKIIYVVTRPKDIRSEAGYAVYEHAEVVRLGTPSFLTGKVPDWGMDDPVLKITKEAVVWTPISEVLQITEFDTLEKAREFFEMATHATPEVEAEGNTEG